MKKNRWSKQKKVEFLILFSNLLEGGFSLSEACRFLSKTDKVPDEFIQLFELSMKKGESISWFFEHLNFSKNQVAQIELGEHHGDIVQTLTHLKRQMVLRKEQTEKLMKVLTYPVLLLFFVGGVLVVLQQFILPQLQESMELKENITFEILRVFPSIFLLSTGIILVFGLFLYLYFRRQSAIKQAKFLARIPLFNTYYRMVMTGMLSRELGGLFSQGLEVREVVQVFHHLSTQGLLKELGEEIGIKMERGIGFQEQVESWNFVNPTFSLMILSGDVKSKIGEELLFYSKMCMEDFYTSVEKKMGWIQPLVFLFVALVIIALYLAILYPIYDSMGGVIT